VVTRNTVRQVIIIIIIIVIVIIIIIILVITFMQGICSYIPETNHISRVYSVAAILYLSLCYMYVYVISPVKYVLYFYISTFRSMCAMPNMAVFCSPLISC